MACCKIFAAIASSASTGGVHGQATPPTRDACQEACEPFKQMIPDTPQIGREQQQPRRPLSERLKERRLPSEEMRKLAQDCRVQAQERGKQRPRARTFGPPWRGRRWPTKPIDLKNGSASTGAPKARP